ncbi:MAG: hypothetical protein Q8P92_05070 [Candidatus Daviesbacteria bacterium]|nr:hypothetical protein [Candidatus Daviesbacteria bacterium]
MEIFLGSIERCLVCPENTDYTSNPLTRDHIIPVKTGKDHRLVLSTIVKSQENFARLCIRDHQLVDRMKLSRYRQQGLIGLSDYIAYDYPKSPDPQIRDMQERQFLRLLMMFQDSLTELNGQTPKELREGYLRAIDHLDSIIFKIKR